MRVRSTTPPSMAVVIEPGATHLPDGWGVDADCPIELSVAPADPTYSRVDVVTIHRHGEGYAVASITHGTPGSATPPVAPKNSKTLAVVEVPAGFTSITTAQIQEHHVG